MKKDKILHFIAGITVSLLVVLIYYCITEGINALIGLFAGFLAGIGKELYDEYDYGGFDKYDMFATWAGSLLGAGLIYILLQGGVLNGF